MNHSRYEGAAESQRKHYKGDLHLKMEVKRLRHAIAKNDAKSLEKLLSEGVDPNLRDENFTPLHRCAMKGLSNLISVLLKYNARMDLTIDSRVDDLLSLNEEYDLFLPNIHYTLDALCLALRNNHYHAAYTLLNHGANPNSYYQLLPQLDMRSLSALKSMELILMYGANPSYFCASGFTPLSLCCRDTGAFQMASLLISYGADVNLRPDTEQFSLLDDATRTGNLNLVKLLVKNGALLPIPSVITQAIINSILSESIEMVTYLLEETIKLRSHHLSKYVCNSALDFVLFPTLVEGVPRNLEKDLVQLLLQCGADPNEFNEDSEIAMFSPLQVFFNLNRNQNPEVLRLLLRYGARLILLSHWKHPKGVLVYLDYEVLQGNPEMMSLVADAAEHCSAEEFVTSTSLSKEIKVLLLPIVTLPKSLKCLSRLRIRESLGSGPALVESIESLEIPLTLKKYLLFQE